MLNFTRSLLELRRERKPLANKGGFDVLHAKAGQVPFVYKRTAADEQVIVGINPTSSPCSLFVNSVSTATPLLVQGARFHAGMLEMASISFGIFSAS